MRTASIARNVMKNLPPRQFQTMYNIRLIVSTVLMWFCLLLGLTFWFVPDFSTTMHRVGMVMTAITPIPLAIFLHTVIVHRRRALSIEREIYETELKSSLGTTKTLNLFWIRLENGAEIATKTAPIVSPEGIEFDGHLLRWNEMARPETVSYKDWWYFSFGKEPFAEQHWTGALLMAYEVVSDLTKHYRNEPIDEQRMVRFNEERRLLEESTSEWGKNGLLLLEKALYLTLLFATAIGLGVMIELRVAEGVGIPIATAIGVIGYLVGLPLLFSKRIKSKYLLNKIGFGHAKGKRHFFLPWDQIDTIVIDGKHLFLHFHEEQNGEFVPFTIRIAYNRVLVERMKELQTKFDVKVRIRSASNEENE